MISTWNTKAKIQESRNWCSSEESFVSYVLWLQRFYSWECEELSWLRNESSICWTFWFWFLLSWPFTWKIRYQLLYTKKIIFNAKIHIFLFRTINFLNCCFCDSRIFWIQDLTIFCVTCNKTTERLLKVDHVALIMEKIFTRCIEELRMHLEGIFWWQLLLWLSGKYIFIKLRIHISILNKYLINNSIHYWHLRVLNGFKNCISARKSLRRFCEKRENSLESWMQLKKLANSVHSIFWSLIVLMKNWWFWKRHKLPLSPK